MSERSYNVVFIAMFTKRICRTKIMENLIRTKMFIFMRIMGFFSEVM